MPIYHQGRKVKEVWHQGRKVKEIWHMGRRIYTSFKPRTFTMTLDPGGLLYESKWNTGSMTGDKALVQSVNGGWLYLAANATYTRTDGRTTGLRTSGGRAFNAGEPLPAGVQLLGDPGTYIFTEAQNKPVEVMPAGFIRTEARDWLRDTLAKYGQSYDTVKELPFDIDSSRATGMRYMFQDCTALRSIPQMDTSNVTGMNRMFQGCSSLTTVPQMDTSKAPNMEFMFASCSSLTSVPTMDTGSATNMSNMFYNCSSLTSVPQMDTRNVTNMYGMFQGCSSLTTVPDMDTSQVTDMAYMFNRCQSLTTVPPLDTRNATTMRTMFQFCSSLTTVPQMDTSKVTDMNYMFAACSALVKVPEMDTRSVTGFVEMFEKCAALRDGNVTLTIKRKGADTARMIIESGLTREPFLTIE